MDHYRFTPEDLELVFKQAVAANLEFLVTTEKDSVRLSADLVPPLPIYYLRLEIEILRGATDFQEAVERICFPETQPAR
jgi:tetraacyldisaccharide 4'-kinase